MSTGNMYHREAVGGMWDEVGTLQFNFMVEMGLEPHHRLLDIGCGSLRGGVHFVEYLESGNYYGVDKNHKLIELGMAVELKKRGLGDKSATFKVSDQFDFGFGVEFDFAIAQSLFTHLPLNDIMVCLHNARGVLVDEGRLYATFFSSGSYQDMWFVPHEWTNGIVTFPNRDPYHYEPTMLMGAGSGLDSEYIGHWDHPRGQHMMEYVKR